MSDTSAWGELEIQIWQIWCSVRGGGSDFCHRMAHQKCTGVQDGVGVLQSISEPGAVVARGSRMLGQGLIKAWVG